MVVSPLSHYPPTLPHQAMINEPASPMLGLATDTTSLDGNSVSASFDGGGSLSEGGLNEGLGTDPLEGGLVDALTSQTVLNNNVSVLVQKLADLEIRQVLQLVRLGLRAEAEGEGEGLGDGEDEGEGEGEGEELWVMVVVSPEGSGGRLTISKSWWTFR